MVSIIPSILVQTPEALRARLLLIQRHRVPLVQLDVADHTLVAARTFHDPDYINTLAPTTGFEIHLMTNVTPTRLTAWRRPWVKKIIVHLEAASKPRAVLAAIRRLGKRAGLAINPETPVNQAKPFLTMLDTILIMGVNPGWGGQQLLPDTAIRVQAARRLRPRGNIEVDGSVNAATIQPLAAAGANLFVVGSFLTSKHFTAQYQQLTALAHAAFPTTPAP